MSNQEKILKLLETKKWFCTEAGEVWSFVRGRSEFKKPYKRKLTKLASMRGYITCMLTSGTIRVNALVHRLVWIYFNGPIPKGYEINHKDGNKANNSLDNLELMTRRENINHSVAIGTFGKRIGPHPWAQGSNHGGAKLSEEAVIQIRRLVAGGAVQRAVAKQFKVSPATVCLISKRKNWSHLS